MRVYLYGCTLCSPKTKTSVLKLPLFLLDTSTGTSKTFFLSSWPHAFVVHALVSGSKPDAPARWFSHWQSIGVLSKGCIFRAGYFVCSTYLRIVHIVVVVFLFLKHVHIRVLPSPHALTVKEGGTGVRTDAGIAGAYGWSQYDCMANTRSWVGQNNKGIWRRWRKPWRATTRRPGLCALY